MLRASTYQVSLRYLDPLHIVVIQKHAVSASRSTPATLMTSKKLTDFNDKVYIFETLIFTLFLLEISLNRACQPNEVSLIYILKTFSGSF